MIPELSHFIVQKMEAFKEVIKGTEFTEPWEPLDDYSDRYSPLSHKPKRTKRSIQRRVTLQFEFGLPSPPWMS